LQEKRFVDVLIVDDDPFVRGMLAELLEDEGYRVVSAADGEEALSYLMRQAPMPCVILLDLMMPRMNGWEFRNAQRKTPELAAIPVITISAYADLLVGVPALDAAAHFPKPIDLDQLIVTVRHWCAAAGP
jgi:two-component system chemotaxis response regulator CheY